MLHALVQPQGLDWESLQQLCNGLDSSGFKSP